LIGHRNASVQIDPIILGHNQFIGVNYLSWEEGRKKAEVFRDVDKVVEILKLSFGSGINALMFSNNDLALPLMNKINKLLNGKNRVFAIYPVVPFLQKYIRDLAIKGHIGLAYDILSKGAAVDRARFLAKSVSFLLDRDPYKLIENIIDAELLPFKSSKIPVVFLHNEVTNLMLALDSKQFFEFFQSYVRNKYNCAAGFSTGNFAVAVKKFGEWGIKDPIIMTAFNKLGFLMNPSRYECEKALESFDGRVVAMSTLAGGRLEPREAYDYLMGLPNIASIVVGYSTKDHAQETLSAIKNASEKYGRQW
jgi:hypothetical protein